MRVALFACALAVAAQAVRLNEPVALPEPLELSEADAIAESAAEVVSTVQADADLYVSELIKANDQLGQPTSLAQATAFVDQLNPMGMLNTVKDGVG